jgi:hypothetical protein
MTKLYAKLDQQNRTDNAKAEAALKANGLTFVPPAAGEVPRWRTAVATANADLTARGVVPADLLAEAQRLIAEYRASAGGAR